MTTELTTSSHDPAALKARYKSRCTPRNDSERNWQIRVHRAISWYKQACVCPDDIGEGKFLFLWIALNSLYSRWDPSDNIPGKDAPARHDFVWRLAGGPGKIMLAALFRQHQGLIRKILGDPYLSEVFWRNPSDPKAKGRGAEDANHLASNLKSGEIGRVLDQVLGRLYVLRGQIVHGAATSGSRVNAKTRNYGLLVLALLVPQIIMLVIEHHREDHWPELCYPPQP